MAGATRERTENGVEHIASGFHCLQSGHHAQAATVVGMEMNGNTHRLLEARDKLKGRMRINKAGHVFDTDLIHPLVFQFPCFGYKFLDSVHRANGKANRSFSYFPYFLDRPDYRLVVPHIIQCVENPEDIYSVSSSGMHELVHDIVRKIGVRDQVLPTDEHHVLDTRHGFFEPASPFPRIFPQEADAYVKSSATPRFCSVNSCVRELAGHFKQIVEFDASGHFAL